MSENGQKKYLIESFLSLIESFSVLEQKEILDALHQEFRNKVLSPTSFFVPVSIFQKELGALESLCKYLLESLKLSSQDAAVLLSRSVSTIDISFKRATKKYPKPFIVAETVYSIPLSIFSPSLFGIQEAIVGYLKHHYHLTFQQISELLNRKYQTIRTAYINYVEKEDILSKKVSKKNVKTK